MCAMLGDMNDGRSGYVLQPCDGIFRDLFPLRAGNIRPVYRLLSIHPTYLKYLPTSSIQHT